MKLEIYTRVIQVKSTELSTKLFVIYKVLWIHLANCIYVHLKYIDEFINLIWIFLSIVNS